jgi:hypothetical protein
MTQTLYSYMLILDELSYKWKMQNGIFESTMKLSKICMVGVSYHCHHGLKFLNVNV